MSLTTSSHSANNIPGLKTTMSRRKSGAASVASNGRSNDDSDVDRRQLEKERRRRRRRRRERRLNIPAFVGGGEDDDIAVLPAAQTSNEADDDDSGGQHDGDDSSIGMDAAAAARAVSSSDRRRRDGGSRSRRRESVTSRSSLTLKEQKLLNSSHGAFGDSSLHGNDSSKLTLEHKNAAKKAPNEEDHDDLASALAILDTYNDQVTDPTSETVALSTQDVGDGWDDHHDHQINPRSGVLLERYRYASISDLSKTHSQFTASTNGTSRTGGTALSSLTGATKASMLSSATNMASSSLYEAFNVLVEEAVEEAKGTATSSNEKRDVAGESSSSPLSNTSADDNHKSDFTLCARPRGNIPSLQESKPCLEHPANQIQSSANSTTDHSRRCQPTDTSVAPIGSEHTKPSNHRRSSVTSTRHQANARACSRAYHYRRSTLSIDTDTDDEEEMYKRFIASCHHRLPHPSIDSRRSSNEPLCASQSDDLLGIEKDVLAGDNNGDKARPKSKGRRGSVVLSDGEQEADPFDAWFNAYYNSLMYGENGGGDPVGANDEKISRPVSTQLQDDLRRLSLASLDSLTPRRSSGHQHPPQDLMPHAQPLESCPPSQSHLYDSLRRNTEQAKRMDSTENSSSARARPNLTSSIGNGVKAVKKIMKRRSADLKRRSTGGKSAATRSSVRGDPNVITATSSSASLSSSRLQQQPRRHSSYNDTNAIKNTMSHCSATSRRHSAGPISEAAVNAAAAAQSSESYKSLDSHKSLDDSWDSELERESATRSPRHHSMGMNAPLTNSSFTPRMA